MGLRKSGGIRLFETKGKVSCYSHKLVLAESKDHY